MILSISKTKVFWKREMLLTLYPLPDFLISIYLWMDYKWRFDLIKLLSVNILKVTKQLPWWINTLYFGAQIKTYLWVKLFNGR